MNRLVTEKNNKLCITFTFDRDTLTQIHTLPNRKWHSDKKEWSCPISRAAIQSLKDWGFAFNPPELADWAPSENKEIHVQTKKELYPFQRRGVGFIEEKNGRALLGDEMGLGKTVQALAWLQLHPEKRPALIICPASVKLNWEREAHDWLYNPDTQIISGKKTTNITGDIVIINYDILKALLPVLEKKNFSTIILDEIHYCKSPKTLRTKAVKSICKGKAHIIALSGTPIINRPIEAYEVINLLDPRLFLSRWKFAERYCNLRHNRFGWDFSGASNTEELHSILKDSIMIRRLKKDVLQDLPPKVRSIIPLEISNKRIYNKAESDLIDWVSKSTGEINTMNALTKIEWLKQLSAEGKMEQAINWIQDYIEDNGKLVIFATHKFVIDKLMETFGDKAVKIDGSITQEKRQEAVDKFQNDKSIRLFIGNIKAAGVGITLTAASGVAFLELGWSPGEHDQAEDRIHRIGQEADSVNVYYLLSINTIDEKISDLLDKKRQVVGRVLDGKEATEDSTLLGELIESFK